ncbi:helix-turn-helix transcriptional regulator [Streptomyces sp. NPDC048272]|uniref:helix-turn-helix transcriptional regulator n=1 Tax=Streptomyces sp. NPDC048272 TaxID=3154616 RepID=UPI003438FE8A
MTALARPVLTDTELAVLAGAAEGDTYAVIGARLGLHEKSVSKMAVRAGRKLGARGITNAVLLACRAGLLDGRPQRHGDHAGYEAHRRRGEDPKLCELCSAGERAHKAALKARQRAQNAA